MALSFPLPWASTAATLPLGPSVWRVQRFEEITRSADARPWVNELAAPRWLARITLGVMPHPEALAVQALLDLHGSEYPILLHDPRRMAPAADPFGAILGAAMPVIHTVDAGDGFRIAGLPAGYVLSRGDLIGVRHPDVGRQALYEVIMPVVTAGTGITPLIHVRPRPRPQAAVGQAVQLLQPMALMILQPDSFEPGEPDGFVQRGMRFDAVEAW